MSNEEILLKAMHSIAATGNAQAIFALSLINETTTSVSVRSGIVSDIKEAHERMSSALKSNEREWSRETDRQIISAQKHLLNALTRFV